MSQNLLCGTAKDLSTTDTLDGLDQIPTPRMEYVNEPRNAYQSDEGVLAALIAQQHPRQNGPYRWPELKGLSTGIGPWARFAWQIGHGFGPVIARFSLHPCRRILWKVASSIARVIPLWAIIWACPTDKYGKALRILRPVPGTPSISRMPSDIAMFSAG